MNWDEGESAADLGSADTFKSCCACSLAVTRSDFLSSPEGNTESF